jgi:hypothetical protein
MRGSRRRVFSQWRKKLEGIEKLLEMISSPIKLLFYWGGDREAAVDQTAKVCQRRGPIPCSSLDSIRIQTIEILYNFKLIIIKIELNYKERIKTMIPYHPY